MIQFSNKSNSIVQFEKKNITQNGNTKSTSHQISDSMLPTIKTTLPVMSNVIAEEEACLSVNTIAAAKQ